MSAQYPTAPVDIGNISLDYLGQESITDFTSTDHGILCGRHYDLIRRGLIREYMWNWAKRRTLISRTRTPAFDFADAYLLPRDCLRIINFGSPSPTPPNLEGLQHSLIGYYDIEDDPNGGLNILVNNAGGASLALRYNADITDVTKFDPLFIKLLAIYLGLAIAFQVTKNKDDVDRLNKMLAIEIPMAISIDGQENPPTRIETSRFINSRLRGTTGNNSVAGLYTEFD